MRVSVPGTAQRRSFFRRSLFLEALEDRRLLAAAPWQNPVLPRDVNHDGIVVPNDAGIVINRLIAVGISQLPPPVPPNEPQFYYDTDGNNILSPSDALRIINRLITPPTVSISTLVPFSIDVTPQVTVTAASTAAIPDGTQVQVDVDLDGDGTFTGAGETNHTLASLFHGASTFDITPAVPRGDQPYNLKMQAHVIDSDGVEGHSPVFLLKIDTLMSDVLANYVNTPAAQDDPAYHYSNALTVPGQGFTYYALNMTSQNWRTSADVNQTLWQHWVQIVVPAGTISNTALLLIDGGSTNASPPASPDPALVFAALQTHTVVIDLKDVPNEPLTFTGDNPTRTRSEDAIIAYSFDQFMDHIDAPNNETWPVLLAMVKSAVRAMDSVQSFIPTVVNNAHIDDFVVTGYSKRGWTTWLTAAVDDRVKAIMPGVFDNLNQGPQMVHHFGVYGDRDPSDLSVVGGFSVAVQDYTDLNIFERMVSPEGELLSQIVDPYRYLNNGRFTIPKLLLDSAGDEFFVSDSAQYYIHDLPGTENYLRYFPNTSHGLADAATDVLNSTVTFYSAILNNSPLPKYSWTVEADGSIHVQTVDTPTQVKLWQITNPTQRDFRKAYLDFISGGTINWTSSLLTDQGGGVYVGSTPMPASGATAFFVELTFDSPIPGNPYVFTTEIHVNTNIALAAWPFAVAPTAASPATAGMSTADMNAAAFALAAQAAAASTADEAAISAGPPPASAAPEASAGASTRAATDCEPDGSASELSPESGPDEEAVDFVFGAVLDEVLV